MQIIIPPIAIKCPGILRVAVFVKTVNVNGHFLHTSAFVHDFLDSVSFVIPSTYARDRLQGSKVFFSFKHDDGDEETSFDFKKANSKDIRRSCPPPINVNVNANQYQ